MRLLRVEVLIARTDKRPLDVHLCEMKLICHGGCLSKFVRSAVRRLLCTTDRHVAGEGFTQASHARKSCLHIGRLRRWSGIEYQVEDVRVREFVEQL